MALPEVTYDDVIAEYEGDPEVLGSQKYIERQTAKAVGRLEARHGLRIQARLSSGVLPVALFKSTVAEAVLRIARNPEGYRMEQQGNYQYQTNSAVSAGYLWFTKDNLVDLLGQPFSPIGTAAIGNDWGG